MSDLQIGQILEGECHKDAIHIAIAPMTATEKLMPGQHIGLVDAYRVAVTDAPIGIVDPFLKEAVLPGQRFYMFMYPNTITSLRHEWVHPSFVGMAFSQESLSHKWVEEFAEEIGQTYHDLLEAAGLWLRSEEYTYDNAEKYKDATGLQWETFWDHYEILTGTKVSDHKATFFTCSC